VAPPNPPGGRELWVVLGNGAKDKNDPQLKKLLGTRITLAGWVIPNEYDHDELSAFLLARYPGGCIHVPLPPPENVVYVKMEPKAKKLKDVSLTTKVEVVGTLRQGDRVDASYEFTAESVREVDP
jgi:hypothetical protein